jgi:uncharacterized membrane protein
MDNRSSSNGGILDHVAIALSSLCLIHCLLLPAIIVALPLLAQFNETHFHVQMLIVVIPVSLFAFGIAYRRHRNKAIIVWGIVGIAIMFVGGTVAHANYGALADTALTMAGAIILATAHYFNNRLTGHVAAS